jgi:TonB family protein
MPGPDPSKPIPSATGVLRARPEDANFEADFADLAARFAAQSGGGLSPELSADLALEIVLNEVVEQACLATGATGAAIALLRNGEMVCRASSGATAPQLGSRLDSPSGLSGECIRTHRTQRCDDVLADLRVDIEASARLGVRSVMVMPLLRESELVGIFELFSSLPSAFGERDERTLEALAGRILNNLDLSNREASAPPLPSQPVPESVSESPAESATHPESAPKPADSVSELVTKLEESSPRREFDLATTFLGVAVLVCAVLLGILIGKHMGFQKAAARVRRPAVPAASASPLQRAPVQTPGAEKEVSSTTPAPAVRAQGDAIPPGSLRVYDNGREVFRQAAPSKGGQSLGDSSSAGRGTAMQRAASIAPEEAQEIAASPASSTVVLHRVEPEYPETARQMHLQGPVVLDVRIAEDGGVQDMTVVSGQPLLAQAAQDAVKQWRFKPRLVNGHPAAMQTRITLNFHLPQ